MLRIVIQFVLGMLLSFSAFALDSASAVFSSISSRGDGTFIAAKNLFLGEQGGIWLHDVHGRILFFDGENVLPDNGGVIDTPLDEVAFNEGRFWTFSKNEVYQYDAYNNPRLIFSLKPGSEIRRIGASRGYIWVSDGAYFHTYELESQSLKTYSLLDLYQHNQGKYVYLNDAVFAFSKWVVATTSGVYISDKDKFKHIPSSAKHNIEKLYYSPARRELVVGTRIGAMVFDVTNPGKPIAHIGDSHVLSIAETGQDYWVGTEHGLFYYSFLSGEVFKVESASFQEIDLANTKIYSLLNDNHGRMWIATSEGLRYFSLFSQKINRVPLAEFGHDSSFSSISSSTKDGVWLADEDCLYFSSEGSVEKVRTFDFVINDIAQSEDLIWLATDKGLKSFMVDGSLKEVTHPYLWQLGEQAIDHVAVTSQGKVWVVSDYDLYQIDPASKELQSLGKEWLVEKYLPAKVSVVKAIGERVAIGTDHGYYLYDGDRIRFERESNQWGSLLDIEQSVDGSLWFAAAYGLYKKPVNSRQYQRIPLAVSNSRPTCLVDDSEGMWVTSSTGLSYFKLSGTLSKHFSSALGLINNEFLPAICGASHSSFDSTRTLKLGSKFGLVSANSQQLLYSELPESKVIVSQIRLESDKPQVGSSELGKKVLPYGTSLSFVFSVMPNPLDQGLFYRFGSDQEWQPLEGSQLALEHLSSGEYDLQVSTEQQVKENRVGASVQYTVLEPWYQSAPAIASFIVLIGFLIAIIVLSRSRYMMSRNKELAEQVSLKTNQLRHQGKVLLNSNQQLRKQIQVRNVLVDHMASAVKKGLQDTCSQLTADTQSKIQEPVSDLFWKLDELSSNELKQDSPLSQQYNITHIIQSIVSVWRSDMSKAGIDIELNTGDRDYRVTIQRFNLDVVFNTLFFSVIKRAYRGQSLKLTITSDETEVLITAIDHGQAITNRQSIEVSSPTQAELHIGNLPHLVEASGGRAEIQSFEADNRIEMYWPLAGELPLTQFVESATVAVNAPSIVESEPEIVEMSPEQEWLQSVYQLVETNFHDPDFGTTTAARSLFMSERNLQRKFKAMTNRTFKDYVIEVRLEAACESLLAGVKISDVAFNCGFNDPSYFSQKFKHHFGLPPSKFAEVEGEL